MKRRVLSVGLKLTALLAVVLATGCAGSPERGESAYAPVAVPAQPAAQQQYNGAIYQAGYDMALFQDLKARRVGDILTVVLVEQTDAQKTASSAAARSNTQSITNPTLFGQPVALGGGGDVNLGASLSSSTDFSGEGDASQSNSLVGSIAVTVAEVLPNGNLVVQGEKWIAINNGDEYIRLRGIVRPVDIASNNSVLSTSVANAQISYGGKGAIADAQKMGWLARFFISAVWPF